MKKMMVVVLILGLVLISVPVFADTVTRGWGHGRWNNGGTPVAVEIDKSKWISEEAAKEKAQDFVAGLEGELTLGTEVYTMYHGYTFDVMDGETLHSRVMVDGETGTAWQGGFGRRGGRVNGSTYQGGPGVYGGPGCRFAE